MNMEAIEKFGSIAAARKSALLTQPEMAERIGCTTQALLEWEKNPEKLRIKDLVAIYENVGADGKAIIEKYVDDLFLAA